MCSTSVSRRLAKCRPVYGPYTRPPHAGDDARLDGLGIGVVAALVRRAAVLGGDGQTPPRLRRLGPVHPGRRCQQRRAERLGPSPMPHGVLLLPVRLRPLALLQGRSTPLGAHSGHVAREQAHSPSVLPHGPRRPPSASRAAPSPRPEGEGEIHRAPYLTAPLPDRPTWIPAPRSPAPKPSRVRQLPPPSPADRPSPPAHRRSPHRTSLRAILRSVAPQSFASLNAFSAGGDPA